MEFCTDDAARVAAVAAAGVTVEADAAERARDLGEAEAESAALPAPRRPARTRRGGGDAARARSSARCCWRRAPRRAAAPAAPTRPPTSARRRRGTRSAARSRPPGCAGARPRRSSPPATATRPRESLGAAHAVAVRLGAGWLRSEIEGLAARAPRDARGRRRGAGGRARGRRGHVRAHVTRAPGARAASPRAPPTARSARRCTWPRRPPASTSRGSSASSTCAPAPRPPPSRTGTGSLVRLRRMPSPEAPLTGSCACGAVRFEITAPFSSAGYCHCKRCQRRSGALWALNGIVDAERVPARRGRGRGPHVAPAERHARSPSARTAAGTCSPAIPTPRP